MPQEGQNMVAVASMRQGKTMVLFMAFSALSFVRVARSHQSWREYSKAAAFVKAL